ncbi:MAG: GNAT family N-acetyltransferase [Alphaproteobacteria bacterium]|nr:GNAT family N-acetyltransferase [Alphaproteobacteria bacterium]
MTLSEKLDANIMGKFVYLPKLMRMEVIEQSGGVVVDTNIPCDMFNIVCCPKSALDVKSVCDRFWSRNLPFAFWVGFDNEYSDFQNDIEKIGLNCDETESGMAVSIDELDFEIFCEKLEIELVSNAELLQDFITVYKNLIPNDANAIEKFYKEAAPFILDPNSRLKLFVGFYEGMPVATGALFLQDNIAGVWDVTTLPKFRRKGIGTDMTLYALKYAKDSRNYGIGVLTASSDGESIYQKIGFRKIKEFRIANVSVK